MNEHPSPSLEPIYVANETGWQQLKGGSTTLSAAALRFLVPVDGKLTQSSLAFRRPYSSVLICADFPG
ncbi:MAG: hypothetical protein WBM28_01730 [Burkholderiales bacterium]